METEKGRFIKDKTINDILLKYPDKIPIICNKNPSSKIKELPKKKYLVTKELTLAQFTYLIRKHIDLLKNETIFIHCGNYLASSCSIINDLYHQKKADDGILYLTYSSEETFG